MGGVSLWIGTIVLLTSQFAMLAQSEQTTNAPEAEVSSLSATDGPTSDPEVIIGGDEVSVDADQPAEDISAMGLMKQFFANPLNLILISAILFMFIVVRPQQKAAREAKAALSALKKNDRVVTGSGIHGTVIQANEGEATIVIRIDENTGARMTVNRDAVSGVIGGEDKKKT